MTAAPRPAVLVVGSGIAGLTAALEAAEHAEVLLVTKGELAEGSTLHAQGGIAGAVDPVDTPEDHARDTLAAGAGLADEDAVRLLCAEGPAAIARLVERGVAFDRTDGPGAPYALGLEGAHGRPRILHAGGDATGRAIELALLAALRRRGVTAVELTALVDFVVEGGRVRGAQLLGADGTISTVTAGAVVLATGGAGRLFARTTNPAVATGDGVAAAARAGAALADLEMVQFHPTALASGFLVSEAVRGEGALLLDEDGHRFMPAVDPRAELAPRDVVAREIARVMERQDGRPVLLDARAIGAERLAARFPTIHAAVRAAGLDWTTAPIPVTPAAHYWMGGIRTDLDGRTTVPGLLAAGECARTGVHGANRLASNSLLEGAVFGARAGAAAVHDAAAPVAVEGAGEVAPAPVAAPVPGADWTRAELQRLMFAAAGLLREGSALEAARDRLSTWAVPAPTSVTALEDRNLLELGRALTAAALARTTSVGAHHRLDDPSTRPAAALEALAC